MKNHTIIILSSIFFLSTLSCKENNNLSYSNSTRPLSDEQLKYIQTDGEVLLRKFERIIKDESNLTKEVPEYSNKLILNYDKTRYCLNELFVSDQSIINYNVVSLQPNQFQFTFDKIIEKDRQVCVQFKLYFYDNYQQAKRFAPMQLFFTVARPNKLPDHNDRIGDYNWEFPKKFPTTSYDTVVLYSNIVVVYNYYITRELENYHGQCQTLIDCQRGGKEFLIELLKELEKCQTN